MVVTRNQLIASALAINLGVDLKNTCVTETDIPTLYTSLTNDEPSDEIFKWLSFVERFSQDQVSSMSKLNQHLACNSVMLGHGTSQSHLDIIIFAVAHSYVSALSLKEREEFKNLLRWMSYIQEKNNFGELFSKIEHEKPCFDFETPLGILMSYQQSTKSELDAGSKKSAIQAKDAENVTSKQNPVRKDDKSITTQNNDANQSKKEQRVMPDKHVDSERAGPREDITLSVSLLNIQIGVIRKAWKHPSADSLLVEEIDVGEAKVRQVVSGLAKYCTPEELTDRRIVLITNVKPGKLRDIMSEGLVLCASNDDHSIVEPLLPPQGALIGEKISFPGIDGKPEDVLNPKKKQLEKITPNLFTDENCVATFKGIPFMTSAGPCMSSLAKATIK